MRLSRRKLQPFDLTPSAQTDTAASMSGEMPELPRVVLRGPNFPPPSGPLPGVGDDEVRRAGRRPGELDGTDLRPRTQSKAAVDGVAGASHAYLIASIGAGLWAGCFIAFVLGFRGHVAPLTYPPFASVVLAMLTVLPAGFMLVAAYAVRQAARLAADTREAQRLAKDLARPAALAAGRTGDLMSEMREEVERAAAAAASAHERLASLQEALSAQTGRLNEIAGDSQRVAQAVGETLEQDRARAAALADTLQARAGEIGLAIESQTRLVAEASDLASSQLQEAEATLAARSADVTAAAAGAGAAAQAAGDHLLQQTGMLDAASAALIERMQHLDARLSEHHGAMAGLLDRFSQADDEAATRLEARRAQLVEAIAQARIGEAELGDASTHGAELLQGLITAAAEQVRDLVVTVQSEQAQLSQRALEARGEAKADLDQAIAALGDTAETAFQRVATKAEEIRRIADGHVQTARAEVEQLGEVAFEAGVRANRAFDARVSEARKLIDQAGTLVEEAGQRSAARIEAGLQEAGQSVTRLVGALADMDTRMAGLPDQTRARVEAMRTAADRGVVELGEAMRRLTEETRSADAAFQERVRRNAQALHDAAKSTAEAAAAMPAAARAVAPRAVQPSPSPRPEPPAPEGPTDFDDDFVAPETLFERDAYPRAQPPARTGEVPRGGRPAFAGGRPPTPQVFGRAGRSEHDEDPLLEGPAVNGARHAEGPHAEPLAAGDGLDGAAPQPHEQGTEPDRLRPRLRLTPTEADKVLKTVFDPLQGREPKPAPALANGGPPARAWEQDMDEWTWKDLLSSIDEAPAGQDHLAEQMIGEIAALGVDAAALLPRPRVEEIAASVRAGDPLAARESVRRLAPAAVRRLSRRVLVDKALREQADRYVRHYEGLLRGAGDDDDQASTLLSSDPGRAYLLLDAAVGDLR